MLLCRMPGELGGRPDDRDVRFNDRLPPELMHLIEESGRRCVQVAHLCRVFHEQLQKFVPLHVQPAAKGTHILGEAALRHLKFRTARRFGPPSVAACGYAGPGCNWKFADDTYHVWSASLHRSENVTVPWPIKS